jgi:hypothetical protein
VDAQAGAPQHDDESAQPSSVDAGAGVSHDGDDLGDRRRVGRVALALVARRAAGVEAGQRGRRARAAGSIEKDFRHDASLRLGGAEPFANPPAERLPAALPGMVRSSPGDPRVNPSSVSV